MARKVRSTEVSLLLLVAALSILANLPEELIASYIDQRVLLIILALVVVIALLRYLRLLLFLCVLVLAVGANIPERMAEAMEVNQTIMLIFLAGLVAITQMNRLFKLPTDNASTRKASLEKLDSEESRKAILIAISRGNVKRIKWFFSHNTEFNFSLDGETPVTLAAEKGQSEIMQLLIYHKVSLNVTNGSGKTPLQLAEEHGFTRTAELIKFALENFEEQHAPQSGHPPQANIAGETATVAAE